MADLTPGRERLRNRIEGLIAGMAPGLNLILAAGDRLSRIVEPEDQEHYVRSAREPALLEAPDSPSGEADA